MNVKSARDFFTKFINVNSSIMEDEYKLTPMEVNFLVECCMYNYEGNNVNNLDGLAKHFLAIKFFTHKRDVSLYKYKISSKKWALTGRDIFTLPAMLNKKEGDELIFNLSIKLVEDEISDR